MELVYAGKEFKLKESKNDDFVQGKFQYRDNIIEYTFVDYFCVKNDNKVISNAKKAILNRIKEIVLFEYYRRSPGYGHNSVIPSTYISEISKFPLYYVRKCIKKLVEEGMLVSSTYVYIPAYWEREYQQRNNVINRGFCITQKGNEYIENLKKNVFVNGEKHIVDKYPRNEIRKWWH